jgi:predicted nucleotidyltransferase
VSLAISPAHGDLLGALRHSERAPRVVVIGAAALSHHIRLRRSTADVDLVIVAEADEIRALLESVQWRRDPRQPQRWRDGSNNIVDVLPATHDVIAAGEVTLDGANRLMSTVGFDLVLDHASPVEIGGTGTIVEVASLAAIVVLKMVAWLDRPHERQKDLSDLGEIFDAALDEWDDRRWEEPLAEVEHELQAALFVGREVGAIIRPSHRVKIDEFLAMMGEDTWMNVMGAGALVCADPEVVAKRRLAVFRSCLV